MEARVPMRNPWASMTLVVFLLATRGRAPGSSNIGFPFKVRVPELIHPMPQLEVPPGIGEMVR